MLAMLKKTTEEKTTGVIEALLTKPNPPGENEPNPPGENKPNPPSENDWCDEMDTRLKRAAEKGQSTMEVCLVWRTKRLTDGRDLPGWMASDWKKVHASRWISGWLMEKEATNIPVDFQHWWKASNKAMKSMQPTALDMAQVTFQKLFDDYLHEVTEYWRNHSDVPVEVVKETNETYEKSYCFYPGQREPGYTDITETINLCFDWSDQQSHSCKKHKSSE
jgi:hypothetical protein